MRRGGLLGGTENPACVPSREGTGHAESLLACDQCGSPWRWGEWLLSQGDGEH